MSVTRIKEDVEYFTEIEPLKDPVELPNLLFWLDATQITSGNQPANGGAVSSWLDKSSNQYLFTQVDANQPPIYLETGFRGRPTVRVSDTTDGLAAPSNLSSPAGSYTFFFVGQQVESRPLGFNSYLLDVEGSNRFLIWLVDDISSGFYYQDTFKGPGSISESGELYATWRFDQSRVPSAEIRKDGALLYTDNSYLNTSMNNNLRIASRFTAELNDDFDGRISEFIAYERTLSDTEVLSVESYLKTKWGF